MSNHKTVSLAEFSKQFGDTYVTFYERRMDNVFRFSGTLEDGRELDVFTENPPEFNVNTRLRVADLDLTQGQVWAEDDLMGLDVLAEKNL